MTIYDIDNRIAEILSETDENGELPSEAFDELTQLNADREIKIENAACMVVNLTAEAKAIREQEIALAERRKAIERRVERVKNYIEFATDGNSFSSPRVQVKYGKSTVVELDEDQFWFNPAEAFIRRKPPEADKAAIKAALKDGAIIPGAWLVEKKNMTIK